jgi:soluble lytic murein transglycosylase
MGRRGSRFRLLLLLVTTHGAGAQVTGTAVIDALPDQRDEFRIAFEHARAGEIADAADPAVLLNHPLYDYLQAERLASLLARAGDLTAPVDMDAARFLAAHAGEPVAWPLHFAWLASLARRQQWQVFLDQYAEDVADDRLRCQSLAARIALQRIEGLAPAIIDLWLTPRQLPTECEPVFQWLRSEGALTDAHVEERVRLLLESGQTAFARIIARRLPDDRSAPLLRWADFIEHPAQEIADYLADPSADVEQQALRDGWSRVARDAPDAALNLYAPLMAALQPNDGDASAYALVLALGLAWDRRREALDFFEFVAPAGLDDYALGWRARAALWAGDWALAERSIAEMSATQRSGATWRYWAARVVEIQQGRSRATQMYESLLSDDNYYSGLSAARLRRRLRPNVEPLPRNAVTVATLAGQAAFVRARALVEMGLPVAAMREWRYGFSQLDQDAQRQSIHLAADWQWYDLAVATATRFGVFNDYDLLYPMPFGSAVLEAVRATELGTDLVYGVIRQESLYRSDAVSGAGARGLMQLRPGTAAQIVRGLDVPEPSGADLLDPTINIRLGTAELDRLVDRFDGQLPVALAAYNAGASAAERWLPDRPIDADVWVENIPFNETRGYVQRVLWHSLVFRWLETQRAQDTRVWLERISP